MQVSTNLKFLLLASISLLPLLGPNNIFGYESIKVLFFILSISLIGFLSIKIKFQFSLISKASGLFILILLITSLTGIDPKISFLGSDPYFQGFILYAYLFLFSLLVSHFKINMETWAKVLTISSSLVAFLAINQWIRLNLFEEYIPTYAGRVVSSFGQPNFYAGFLLLTLPFSYMLWKREGKISFLGWGSGLLCAVGILVSYSRLAILMLFFLIILAFIDQLKIRFRWVILTFAFILIALAVSVLISLNFSSGLIWNELVKPVNNQWLIDNSPEKRILIWPVLGELIIKKPFLGYGLENITLAFSNYFIDNKHFLFEENLKVQPALLSLKDLNLNRSHNYILDLLLFSGTFGLVGWLGLVGVILKKLTIDNGQWTNRKILMVSLITYLIWIQFQNQSIVHLVYFWFIVGIVDSMS